MNEPMYDLIIIGAGAAGMTAAIYAARYKLDCLVLAPDVGGTANLAHDIENWPGFKGHGMDLMEKFSEHATSFGVPIINLKVEKLERKGDHFVAHTANGQFKGLTVILAMGTQRRKLGVAGEAEFAGKGVSYCATCDCVFYKNRVVGVVGGGDAAAMGAQILSQHATKVIIIYRKAAMTRAEPARVAEIENDPKIEFIYNANVVEIYGDDFVNRVKLDTGQEIELEGIFIEIGGIPTTKIVENLGVELVASKKIKVDQAMATSVPGVFAAGDITTGSNEFNQVVTAAAEGAIATLGAFNYVRRLKYHK
jgi:thioredoxin reductase (NADPH)